MGLTITRRVGESFRVGDATVTVRSVGLKVVKVTVDAPPQVRIVRSELEELLQTGKESHAQRDCT